MKIPRPSTIDFETHAIDDRPRYPPVPVGVSIKLPGKKSRYYAWGHVTGNNCSWGEARDALLEAAKSPDGVCCHHGKFDADVAETHMGVTFLGLDEREKLHDTLFLAYLDDPHQRDIGLKALGVRLLGEEPSERDEVVEWLVANQPIPGIKISRAKQSPHYAMKYLAWAPVELVGRYACGDTDRTDGVFKLLWPKIEEQGMLEAYKREQTLMPLLLAAERRGVHVDMPRLRADLASLTLMLARIDAYLHRKLGDINLNSGEQVIEVLLTFDLADATLVGLTIKGKHRSDANTMRTAVRDRSLGALLAYRSELQTCLKLIGPWLAMAEETGGSIHTQFNQTISPEGGTRTGRLSCTWFMNMPKEFEPLFKSEKHPKLPKPPRGFEDLPPIPRMRGYLIPRPGYVFIDRDYSQQEPRILAHFDGGALLQAYLDNPWIDFHDYAKAELEHVGLFYDRKPVKNTNLGLIYGMGVGKLAEKNNMSAEEANGLKQAILELYPGLAAMYKDMKVCAANGEPIRTWGGRVYYCEEPRIVDGRIRKFDYKLVNVLVQGSAADCTKAAIIRYHEQKPDMDFFLLPVHDQMLAEVLKTRRDAGMEILRESMETIEFEVPMLSEGDWSDVSWADLQPYDKKGKRLAKAA